MGFTHRVGSLMLIGLLLVAAGCSGKTASKNSDSPTSKAPTATQNPVPKIKVKVGGTAKNSLKHYPALIANHPDIVAKTGVEFEFAEYRATGDARRDMQLGTLDFGFITSTDLMVDSSSDIQLISVMTTSPLEALIVNANNKNEIKSVKDLLGKPVGVSAIGSATHLMLLSILQLHGVDTNGVQITPVGTDVAKSFAENKVVAALAIEPNITTPVASGKAVILQDVRYPDGIKRVFGEQAIPWSTLAVRKDYARKNPDVIKQLRTAIQMAAEKMNSLSPEEVIKLLPGDMQNAENLAVYKANVTAFPRDTMPKKNELEAVVNNMKTIKAIPATYTLAPDVIYN